MMTKESMENRNNNSFEPEGTILLKYMTIEDLNLDRTRTTQKPMTKS